MAEKLTDKKLKNKRFRATEESIRIAYFLVKDTLSLDRLLRFAGISRSTLYRHHGSIGSIVPDYERYILRKIRRILKRILRARRTHLRTLYGRILAFMTAHKKIMEFLLAFDSRSLTEEIVLILKPKLLSTGKFSSEEILRIYTKEVSSIIEAWQKSGFRKDEITVTLDKIMYLTDTAYIRLAPLASFTSSKK